MLTVRSVLYLTVLGSLLLPVPADAGKRCRCGGRTIYTVRSCAEACGRGPGPEERRRQREERRREAREERDHERTMDARRNVGGAAAPALGASAAPRPPTRRAVPQQRNLGNLDRAPVSDSVEGVFCSEGEVVFPRQPTAAMQAFCRKQTR